MSKNPTIMPNVTVRDWYGRNETILKPVYTCSLDGTFPRHGNSVESAYRRWQMLNSRQLDMFISELPDKFSFFQGSKA
jgi:hypothetical protein